RADVFSLGCVLFEALTGRPPFTGQHWVAVLAKVLLEEAPRLRELRPDVPPALDQLVARMLAKHALDRPSDEELLASPRSMDSGVVDAVARRSLGALPTDELKLLSIVLAAGEPEPMVDPNLPTAASVEMPTKFDAGGVLASFGAQVERLADGTIVAI